MYDRRSPTVCTSADSILGHYHLPRFFVLDMLDSIALFLLVWGRRVWLTEILLKREGRFRQKYQLKTMRVKPGCIPKDACGASTISNPDRIVLHVQVVDNSINFVNRKSQHHTVHATRTKRRCVDLGDTQNIFFLFWSLVCAATSKGRKPNISIKWALHQESSLTAVHVSNSMSERLALAWFLLL